MRAWAHGVGAWLSDGWFGAFENDAARGETMRGQGWYAEGNAEDARGEGHFVCV